MASSTMGSLLAELITEKGISNLPTLNTLVSSAMALSTGLVKRLAILMCTSESSQKARDKAVEYSKIRKLV